jgi:hypothetical protein
MAASRKFTLLESTLRQAKRFREKMGGGQCSTAQDDGDSAGAGVRGDKKEKRPLMDAKARIRPMAKQGAQGSQFQ